MYLSLSHWSGQGAHSSWLANLKQIVTGRRWEGGRRKAFQLKLEQNGVTKIFFDRKDIMLLSTVTRLWSGTYSPLHSLAGVGSARFLSHTHAQTHGAGP